MEKEDTISVQWLQGDVETSYSLVNNNNCNSLTLKKGIYFNKFKAGKAAWKQIETRKPI